MNALQTPTAPPRPSNHPGIATASDSEVDAQAVPTDAQIAATHPDFIDVSHHQGDIDWAKYAATGRNFGIVKATEGGDWSDDHLAANRAAMTKAGMKIGVYHFARPDGADMNADATMEANNYLKTVGTLGKNEFPVLDFEVINGLKPDQLTTWAAKWCSTVETATGKTPWLYTGQKIQHQLDQTQLAKYPLWLAFYNTCDRDNPPDAAPWPNLVAWQYTDKAKLPGVDGKVDASYLYGTVPGEFPAAAASNTTTTP